jgi:hypothetical protein
MKHRSVVVISTMVGSVLVLSACTGNRTTPTTSSTPPASTSSAATVPHSGAPKVESPLPAKVLDGTPCDSALSSEQLKQFLGETTAPKTSDDTLGTTCSWSSASGSGAGFAIAYQTKSAQGISLAYQNVQPKAARWQVLDAVQGYPAVAYSDFDDKRHCVVVVGISDELAFSVSLTIGDSASAQGKDACTLAPRMADAVMTNVKQRA